MSAGRSKAKSKKTATTGRIRHLYRHKHSFGSSSHSDEGGSGWESIPRGWISPEGKFFKTKQHWVKISVYLGRKGSGTRDPEKGEKNAHEAYSLGWISVGHGGVLNAVGHKTSFDAVHQPAIVTLRKLLTHVPQFSIRIERQSGKLNPKTGLHEDFDVKEYDLDLFIRHGRLRKYA